MTAFPRTSHMAARIRLAVKQIKQPPVKLSMNQIVALNDLEKLADSLDATTAEFADKLAPAPLERVG